MKRSSVRLLCIALLCTSFAAVPASAATAKGETARLPELTSYPSDPFSAAERDAVTGWVLEQPSVRAHFGDSRTRLLRAGSDLPKRADGTTYRRASLYVRNYDTGLTTIIEADLSSGELHIGTTDALVQPNAEEIEAAAALIRADESLRDYVENDDLVLNGAFFLRSPYRDDPCRHEVCLLFHFVDPGTTSPSRSMRRVLVNMTRGTVVPNDYSYKAIWDSEANSLHDTLPEVR